MAPSAVVVVAAIAFFGGVSARYPTASTPANKLIIKYDAVASMFPGLGDGFYVLPRTIDDAENANWALVQDRTTIDKTTLWCQTSDYRVCLLFDKKGSVCGIQISGDAKEVAASKVPQDLTKQPQWFKHTMLDREMWSTIAYFVGEDVLENGREMNDDTPTAPNGIRVLQSGSSSQNVPLEQTSATGLGYTEQNCFIGMGKHYFAGLSTTAKCENVPPYFLLFGKNTQSLLGFGVLQWGKLSNPRPSGNLFENPPVMAIKMIAPHRPQCLTDWVDKYTLNTLHVYFVDTPGKISCFF